MQFKVIRRQSRLQRRKFLLYELKCYSWRSTEMGTIQGEIKYSDGYRIGKDYLGAWRETTIIYVFYSLMLHLYAKVLGTALSPYFFPDIW